MHVDEADKKKQLETKHDFLKQELTSSETKVLATINQTNKARDEAIKAVCTDGDKGGSVFSEITGKGIEKISTPNNNGDEK